MTLSLRTLLIVPAFCVVSLTCGAYQPPACVPQVSYAEPFPPTYYYYQPMSNGQGQTTYVVRTATGLAGTILSVVNGKLHVQGIDGSKMTCEKFSILVS